MHGMMLCMRSVGVSPYGNVSRSCCEALPIEEVAECNKKKQGLSPKMLEMNKTLQAARVAHGGRMTWEQTTAARKAFNSSFVLSDATREQYELYQEGDDTSTLLTNMSRHVVYVQVHAMSDHDLNDPTFAFHLIAFVRSCLPLFVVAFVLHAHVALWLSSHVCCVVFVSLALLRCMLHIVPSNFIVILALTKPRSFVVLVCVRCTLMTKHSPALQRVVYRTPPRPQRRANHVVSISGCKT